MNNKAGRLVPVILLLVSPLVGAEPSRDELLRTPKYVQAKAPPYKSFTPEALRDALKVISRRNYAAYGFNDPAVTVRLPAVSNSVYATVEFEPPVLKDAKGRVVKYELEQGIFDADTSSTEVRMPKADFARAKGKLTVKYPLVVKTTSIKKGTASKDVKIDGPFVSYNSTANELPEAAFGSKVKPLRAYDASGKELERASSGKWSKVGEDSWLQVPFYGTVAEVRIDRLETWGEVTADYDLPPAPKLPESEQGFVPPLEERMKVTETPGGRVVKR